MAPQLGLGSFRIDHGGGPPPAAYAIGNGVDAEVWALRDGMFQKPTGGGPPVTMTVTDLGVPPNHYPATGDGMCQLLADQGEDHNHFEIRVHHITPYQCGGAAASGSGA